MCPSQCPASRRSSVCEEQACEVECRRLAVGRRRRSTRSYDRARASCVAALVAIQPRTACNAHSVAAPLVVACASLALALAVQAARNSETGLRPEKALETISESGPDLGGAKISRNTGHLERRALPRHTPPINSAAARPRWRQNTCSRDARRRHPSNERLALATADNVCAEPFPRPVRILLARFHGDERHRGRAVG